MSFLSSLGDALSALGKRASAAPAAVEHSSFTGSRFFVLVLGLLALYWAPKGGVGGELVRYGFWLIIAYIASNTVTKWQQIRENGETNRQWQALVYQDGKLDETESKSVSDRLLAQK